MGVKVENHLKEALELAREASKEKEYFWEKNPYGNPYTVVYGYVALLHKRGRLYGNLDRVSFLMDNMTFRQEVMYTYLPRLFQRCRPDKRYIELIRVALAGEVRKGENFVKEIHMEDDEIFLRIIDMSFYMWDNRFVKSVDKMREIITNKELREKVGLTDEITTEPPVALEEEPQVKPKEETKEEAKEETKGRPAIKQSDLNPPKFIKDLEKRDLRTGSSPALRGWLTKLPPDVDKSYEDDDEYEDVPTELALDAFKLTSAKVRKIREELSDRIYGQDSCISKFSEGLFHALTTDFGRTTGGPRGVFLFVGPPGVGKTYLAESLAELLKLPYKRFNMSEYASEQDYFQLTGADRTYKNSHEGILSKHIKKYPDSIIVFDEIEKAGPKVHNIFLQILGLGEYDDDYTKETINCRDTIMIFTSNAGKELYEGRTGDLSEIPESVIMNNIEKERHPQEDRALINPALCSRFGAGCVILFNHVDEEAKLRIVRNGFDRACAKYSKKTSMKLSYDERLPLLFLFHYSNNLDARKASLKSEAFLEKEIYQISRQLGNQKDLLDRAKEIVFELSLPVDDEIKLFFENNKKTGFLAFCGEEMKALFPEKSEDFEVTFKNTEYDGSEDLKEVAAIFVDPYLGCDTNVWHPIGLDDYDCAGMNTLNKIVDSKVGIPVYLLDNKGHISPTDRESLLQLGARGFVNLGEGDENTTLKSLAQTLYISKQCRKLSQKGYILDYDCAIESADDGKKIIVSFYDMWKTQAMDETTGQVALRDEERPDVGLGDVIGAGSAKEELKYYIEYLKDPLKFLQKTGHHPKGLLLYGPPGTGKTMLARALAGETDCSFFQVAASELVSSYAGESKDKVKELFARARKYAPSIIFIDEIDAIGRDRSLGNTESGINALLTEMDGFVKNTDRPVFVLAATNYGAMDNSSLKLDPALLRRFDNRIYVGLPKKSERLEYLEKTAEKRELSISKETLKTIADRTIGQTLDMLGHVFDMAHRMAVRNDVECSDEVLVNALDEYLYGEKKEYTPEYYERVAIHEAGHAYIAWKCGLKPGFITIVSRGNYGGFTSLGDLEDKTEYTSDELVGLIRTSLAGRAAEQEFYDAKLALNTGAESDLKAATGRALDYICKFGMDENRLVSVDLGSAVKSGEYGQYLEKANSMLLREWDSTAELVHSGKKSIKKLADALCDSSYLTEKEILKLLEK